MCIRDSNGTLVFTNGITTNTFVVPIINNNLLEGNTTFTVALTNASLFGILTPPSVLTVTIIENTNSLNNLSANFQLTDPVGVDQFYLGGQNIPLGVALGASSAPLALIDDHHQSGTFGFASPSYTGTGQGAAITVTRTNGSYGNVSLNYATTTNGSTAVLGSDYTAASGTLTFQPTDTNIAFNVPILSSNYNLSLIHI